MTIATVQQPARIDTDSGRDHIVLTGVTWETYRRLRSECDRLHLKMTFDRGTLEIMPPLPDHSIVARFIDLAITVVSEELQIPISGYRDATWHKMALDRGLEADDCYYIQNVAIADRKGTEITLETDPPPDLAVETDITHSSVDKESIYAALKVPELWRWDSGNLRIRVLDSNSGYQDAPISRALPMLPPTVVQQFVTRRLREGEFAAKEAFRFWVRENLLRGSK